MGHKQKLIHELVLMLRLSPPLAALRIAMPHLLFPGQVILQVALDLL